MELRSFRLRREKPDSNYLLSGYAFRFDEIADHYGAERMDKDMEIVINDAVFLLRDHDPAKVLGRLGKNFDLEAKEDGLFFRVKELPDTALASETLELISKDILSGVSIGFVPEKEDVQDEIRVFRRIKIMEVSFVTWPAYDSGRVESKAKLIFEEKKPYRKFKDEKPPELY